MNHLDIPQLIPRSEKLHSSLAWTTQSEIDFIDSLDEETLPKYHEALKKREVWGFDREAVFDHIEKRKAATKQPKASDWPDDESRIDIIGQNGNSGDHYK